MGLKRDYGKCKGYVGIGGVKCRCCNSYHGKHRRVLARALRRVLKREAEEVIKDETSGEELD